ncbi:MAG TPA: hypothetical protein PKI49_12765 [Pseudomonadota bacterium]|nr:hypothetical protein [Pseudomonadota bacterium]HNK43675.1 hypothetical protein [Pseudomonadota bacterium]HNN50074.1 hypothetical protein [Pseudomonadota bacterium]HNO69378.1 hypothetical protein [Pseudomonadota bacterium]
MRLKSLSARPSSNPRQIVLAADPELDAMLDALFASELCPTWQTAEQAPAAEGESNAVESTTAACSPGIVRAA